MRPCVLFLFNSSTYAVDPWIAKGVHCVSVDYTDTDHSAARDRQRSTQDHTRISLDLSQSGARATLQAQLRARGLDPRLVVSFAPCTDLAVSGAAHFARKRQRDPLFQQKALWLAQLASFFGVPYAVENPVSVLSTLWRKPDLIFDPWEFSDYCPTGDHPEAPELYPECDRYNKKTCLWTGNGFCLPVKRGEPPEGEQRNPGHRALGGKSARTKHLRSLTPRGFAKAVMCANIHHVTGQRPEESW